MGFLKETLRYKTKWQKFILVELLLIFAWLLTSVLLENFNFMLVGGFGVVILLFVGYILFYDIKVDD